MKTNQLTGHALNWAVSQVEGIDHDTAILNITIGDDNGWFLDYLTWAQGGPIIEREKLDVFCSGNVWDASTGDRHQIGRVFPMYLGSQVAHGVHTPHEHIE